MLDDNRLKIILAVVAVAIITILSIDPIAQPQDYHNFADQRDLLNIPNFFNVLSSLPFVIVGIMGMRLVGSGRASGGLAELQGIYLTFFAGVFLTGFGSAYYHYHPDNQTLLWDRLPMTIAFMAFFSAIVGEYISLRCCLEIVCSSADIRHRFSSLLVCYGNQRQRRFAGLYTGAILTGFAHAGDSVAF